MNLELTPNEILYAFDAPSLNMKERVISIPEYDEVYKKIRTSLEIKDSGYNVYLIDNFSNEKINYLKTYIKDILQKKEKPKDICYVIYEDEKSPKTLFLLNGNGLVLKKSIEEIQARYTENTFSFYNSTSNKEKEDILQTIHKKRTELVGNLVESAKVEGFDVRPTSNGFTFTPLKDGNAMTEKEYEEMEVTGKENILNKVSSLKGYAQDILGKLKNMEVESINRIKNIMKSYFQDERVSIVNNYLKALEKDQEAVKYLKFVCDIIEKNIIDNYTTRFEEDEESISEIISKYIVNVIVDNSENESPQVIFEEDPSIANLLGSTEYENHNGTYITDASLINGGSLLQANEGCIIIRANSLFSNGTAYYYLKKTLLCERLKFDYNRGYLELLSLSGLKPEPIDIKVKVILIGDYETYDLLYSYDEDFKNIFKIRAEYNPIVDNTLENRASLIRNIISLVSTNKLKSLTDDAIKEVAKFMSRMANDKKKFKIDNEEMSKILILANNKASGEARENIESKDIIDVVYMKEIVQQDILNNYKNCKIIFNIEEELIGSINGLSVIDIGYASFGKPLKITCNCYKGEGNIIDVQKESNMSGQIHNKSINILKGYLNRLLGGYNGIPVDFHLSFEQLYGKIEGDSASVAEIVCILSALSKLPIKQSIAVTGSISQFGEVQPIGGVNEKVEGFFNVCNLKGSYENKGVLIPYSNKDDLVLNSEVESAIKNGKFHIYTMKTVEEAIQVLMVNQKLTQEEIFNTMIKELKKYGVKNKVTINNK